MIALATRDKDEGNPEWSQSDVSTIVEPDTARRVTCDSNARSPLTMRFTPSEPVSPRQGTLF